MRPHRRALLVWLVTLTIAGSLGAPRPARGQVAQSVELRLVAQPTSHEPGDKLGIRLRINNTGTEVIDGFDLTVGVSDRVSTRSGLHDTFTGTPAILSQFPIQSEKRIPPGGSAVVRIREPVSALHLPEEGSDEGGVYPLTITFVDASLTPVDSVTTYLVYYPATPDPPLNLVVVVPLNEVPTRDPAGVFASDEGGDWPLESALDTNGWLDAVLGGLERRIGDVHVAVAPTPRLIEEIADMADGYRRSRGDSPQRIPSGAPQAERAEAWLDRLGGLLNARGIQELLVPYAFPDLPSLSRGAGPLAVQKQIDLAERVLGDATEVTFSRQSLLPPRGRLDRATLEELRLAKAATTTFFTEQSLEQPEDPTTAGCPEPTLSLACPVVVESRGSVRGYQSDSVLDGLLNDLSVPGDDRLELQRFFAETAMIREEAPSLEGRVVQCNLPSLWRPSPRVARLFFGGLARAEWLRTWTPREGLRQARQPLTRTVSETLASGLRGAPDESFYTLTAEASEMVESYHEIRPPESRVQRLERDVLVAYSSTSWSESGTLEGETYAREALDEVQDEFNKITIGGTDEITLTSRRGEIPFSLFNNTGYPVRVKIRLQSFELALDPPDLTETFDESARQVTFEATAEGSGAFPVTVLVETPVTDHVITRKEISVRSTKFNQIALAITFGALAFLVLFYIVRAVRNRRNSTRAPSTT